MNGAYFERLRKHIRGSGAARPHSKSQQKAEYKALLSEHGRQREGSIRHREYCSQNHHFAVQTVSLTYRFCLLWRYNT